MRYRTDELVKKIDELGLTDAQAGKLVGCSAVTIHRARTTGRLSQRIAVALSEKFDVPLVPLRKNGKRRSANNKAQPNAA